MMAKIRVIKENSAVDNDILSALPVCLSTTDLAVCNQWQSGIIFAGVMRRALIYLLFVATLLPSVSQWGMVAYYHANKDYIARVLCQNRDKPELHCDGKCYLAKKLKATQDRQDKETTERVQSLPTLALFCNDLTAFQFLPVWLATGPTVLSVYRSTAYTAPLAGLFRPPRG